MSTPGFAELGLVNMLCADSHLHMVFCFDLLFKMFIVSVKQCNLNLCIGLYATTLLNSCIISNSSFCGSLKVFYI